MKNDQSAESLHQSYTIADVLDELRVEIVKRGWVSYSAPDPLTELVVAELDLPEAIPVIVTEMQHDGPPDLPRQDLASVLARLFARTLGVG